MKVERGNIDPTLRAMGGRARYQLLQVIVINIGSFGAAYQLLDNIFIGRDVLGQRCAAPDNSSDIPAGLQDLDWNSSDVNYDKCQMTVSRSNHSGGAKEYPCLYGYTYDYHREMSFRTEFDLVCDRKLLGSLAQSLVIMGQGTGAVLFSMVSDRFGRKRTLVMSQFALLVIGMLIGVAPNFAVFALLKFTVGGFQQGVVTTMATMSIELFPMEYRSMQPFFFSLIWGMGACSMALFAFSMRELGWRYLQFTLSGTSLFICLLQLWYLDESLRWLVSNGRKESAMRVMERAARVNRKKLGSILHVLQGSENKDLSCEGSSGTPTSNEEEEEEGDALKSPPPTEAMLEAVEETLQKKQAERMTILDIFRHKRLLVTAIIVWISWFATAIAFFSLYMMSTRLHGNRFLNYFLTALMEVPPGFLLYYLVDKSGRKPTSRLFFFLAGAGLLCSGIMRIFSGSSVLTTMSVVMAMVGMVGASGLIGAVFFFTPELFPTNIRNQALGISSFAGRLGGMLAPFMTNLAEVAIWAPGAIIGSLCFLVIFLFRIIPETKGRELPHTIEDIKKWHRQIHEAEEQSDSVTTKC
ncbi:organic anion transporter 3-like [Littorina saxatilis]